MTAHTDKHTQTHTPQRQAERDRERQCESFYHLEIDSATFSCSSSSELRSLPLTDLFPKPLRRLPTLTHLQQVVLTTLTAYQDPNNLCKGPTSGV